MTIEELKLLETMREFGHRIYVNDEVTGKLISLARQQLEQQSALGKSAREVAYETALEIHNWNMVLSMDDAIEIIQRALIAYHREQSKGLVEVLENLLEDTQHKHHDCADEKHCPVLHARKALARFYAGGEKT